jgi:hypothetical protein
MRTTVTIDPDTEMLLREEMKRTSQSFKKVLNHSIRRGLSLENRGTVTVVPLFGDPFPAELATRSMNRLADELDDEETLRELAR